MKNRLHLFICSGICLLSILLTGEHYNSHSLSFISVEKLQFVKEEKGLSITAKAYNEAESKQFLERDLLSRGYQPIQISIQNNSPQSYALKLDELELERVPPHEIARKVMRGAIPRSIAYKVASFLFWP